MQIICFFTRRAENTVLGIFTRVFFVRLKRESWICPLCRRTSKLTVETSSTESASDITSTNRSFHLSLYCFKAFKEKDLEIGSK